MKHKLYLLVLVASLISLAACSKFITGGSNTLLTGKWFMTQTLNDPGDGSGKWIAAEKGQQIAFNKDSTITGNAFPEAVSYRVTDSIHIAIVFRNNTAPLVYRYKLQKNILELNPPCREACGFRFQRLK